MKFTYGIIFDNIYMNIYTSDQMMNQKIKVLFLSRGYLNLI